MRLPKAKLSQIRKSTLLAILAIGIFSMGYISGVNNLGFSEKITISRALPEGRENLDFALFWKTWDTLENNYFDQDKLNKKAMIYGAIKGMVEAVGDPYTVFLPPSENKVVQEDLKGSFEGVGIQIGFKGNQLAVIAPLPDTPADLAGVKAGDFIIGITDEIKDLERGTAGITLPEAVQAIRGPANSTVTLTLLRDGESRPLAVDIKRANIDVPSVILGYEETGEDEKIAHLRLLKFGGETNSEWEKAVREILKDSKIKGIVLDLRNNPGGFLDSSVDIASDFVEAGSTVTIQENADGSKHNFDSTRFARLGNLPVVVLVNGGSASASEILAGAMRDLNKTKLIGQTTFGKGTIQEPKQVNGGSALHITTARWLTPNETWVNGEGLTPDIEISDDPETPQDEELLKALEVLKKSF